MSAPREAQLVADDVEETSPARAVQVALDAVYDADFAVTRAKRAHSAALAALYAARNAEAAS